MSKSTSSKLLVETLYPTVDKHLKNKAHVNELLKGARHYLDRNSDKVFDSGLTHKVVFLNQDKEVIMKGANLTDQEVRATIRQSAYIKDNWRIMTEPINVTTALIARYFTLKKMDDELRLFLIFYSFYFYSSLHSKYFKYGVVENVMNYTVNNLTNKFLLKRYGSLFKTIEHIVMKSHETYKDNLINGEDGDLATYIQSIKVRLNDMVKHISNEYYDDHKGKQYLNYDSDNYDEDNFHIADNSSYAIQRIADGCVIRLNTYGPDMNFAKLAARSNKVSVSEIRNVVTHLGDNETEEIKRLCELILQLFLFDNANKVEDVRSGRFYVECVEIYKKSNTNDKVVLEIKKILDKWLKTYSIKYAKSNREATLSDFRRAIYMYFVIHIQQSASY